MKSSTLFMVSCVLTFFILNHVKEVKTEMIDGVNVCVYALIFENNCGWDGRETCIKGFNAMGEYPYDCECSLLDPGESKRVCRCKFIKPPFRGQPVVCS
ncbi:unnamed protein product [Thlaspi arvense]|uniref:Plethodontid modulating factor n=1 Tax=Thlaspi arvense TaxID=13288 RepID=A0AAU9RZJ4_THLAR|nr:unnamed protein product [Thlaspi arvense]